jgi:hypothetical protein
MYNYIFEEVLLSYKIEGYVFLTILDGASDLKPVFKVD